MWRLLIVLLLTGASGLLIWHSRENLWWGVLGIGALLLSFAVNRRDGDR